MLRELRQQREMTQEELAKKAKITRSHLSLLEAGHRKNPSLAVLKRLAKALDVSLTDLVQ
jgi:transcriptional regulator with XRE-family HTH domain